jgi:molybdopterin converting factor small subunit
MTGTRADHVGVSIVLPRALLPYARGAGTLQIDSPCPTVRDALAQTAARWPAVIDRVLTEQGALRRHVNVFVGDESIAFLDGLDTRVDDGATITIVPAVSGG